MSKLRKRSEMTRSDRKAVKVLKKGFQIHDNLRFLTLTGCNSLKFFRRLRKWLGLSVHAYFGVRTGEGLGVVHIVYAGKGVRYGDLSRQWQIISGCWNVSISKVRNTQKLIEELVLQYKKIRYFKSRNWDSRVNSRQRGLIDGM